MLMDTRIKFDEFRVLTLLIDIYILKWLDLFYMAKKNKVNDSKAHARVVGRQ